MSLYDLNNYPDSPETLYLDAEEVGEESMSSYKYGYSYSSGTNACENYSATLASGTITKLSPPNTLVSGVVNVVPDYKEVKCVEIHGPQPQFGTCEYCGGKRRLDTDEKCKHCGAIV